MRWCWHRWSNWVPVSWYFDGSVKWQVKVCEKCGLTKMRSTF